MRKGTITGTIYKAFYNTLRYSLKVKRGVILDIPILVYHQIGLKKHSEYPSIYTSKDSFEEQMRVLIRKLNLKYKTILDAGCAEGHLSFLEKQKIKADFIYSLDVLIYLKDDREALKQFYKCLDKKGLLFIHVPRKSPVFDKPKLYFRRFLSFSDKSNLGKENVFEQKVKASYEQQDLEDKVTSAGFQIIQENITFGYLAMVAHTVFELIRSKSRIYQYFLLPFLLFLVYFDILIPKKEGAGLAILAQK